MSFKTELQEAEMIVLWLCLEAQYDPTCARVSTPNELRKPPCPELGKKDVTCIHLRLLSDLLIIHYSSVDAEK